MAKHWVVTLVRTERVEIEIEADNMKGAVAAALIKQRFATGGGWTAETADNDDDECFTIIGTCEGCGNYICEGERYSVDNEEGHRFCRDCSDSIAEEIRLADEEESQTA